MNRFQFFGVLALSTLASSLRAQQPAPSPEVEKRVAEILAGLTLDEKLGQLRIVDGHAAGGWKPEHMALAQQGLLGGTFNVRGVAATTEMQQAALGSRNKVPLMFAFDVVHGYRTVFPSPLAEASAWDPGLSEACAAVAAKEARSAGVVWTLAPIADVARDPRWGRIVEGAGEDTVLCSALTAARVRGFQGKDVSAPDRVVACLKHFAASGAAEGGRDYNAADVSLRVLRETYFPPFQAGIAAGAGSVMASFSAVDGVPATCNAWLLKDVLRKEWGYQGVVVTDYEAINELMRHGVAGSSAEAGAMALNAGVTVEMRSDCFSAAARGFGSRPALRLRAVDSASLLPAVDAAVGEVLRMKLRLGLFDRPLADAARETAALLSDEHRKLAREAAAKSCVLLKNNLGTLPIPAIAKKIAIVGPLADDRTAMLGSWPGDGRPEDVVTLVDAVKQRLGAKGKVIHSPAGSSSGFSFRRPADVLEAAKDADFIIAVVGEPAEMSGEAACRSSLDLPQQQLDLLQKVHGMGKPYAVVLITGRPLTIAWVADTCPAILLAWQGGTMAGPGIADVLFGEVNPSGKLPVTFPRSAGQIPLTYNATSTGRPGDDQNKWTSKYLDVPNSPQWPFGFGLSYSDFAVSAPQLTNSRLTKDGTLTCTVQVTNRGTRDGDEVVQLYIHDDVASVARPRLELKAFRRVSVPAGKSASVEFSLPAKDLGFWTPKGEYVVEPGSFTLMAGNSSANTTAAGFILE